MLPPTAAQMMIIQYVPVFVFSPVVSRTAGVVASEDSFEGIAVGGILGVIEAGEGRVEMESTGGVFLSKSCATIEVGGLLLSSVLSISNELSSLLSTTRWVDSRVQGIIEEHDRLVGGIRCGRQNMLAKWK